MTRPHHILALEPYYGGSHRAFLDGWMGHSCHRFTTLTLPAHHWKWRMRHGAVSFAAAVELLMAGDLEGARATLGSGGSVGGVVPDPGIEPDLGTTRGWDALFVSSMVNLAELYGLLPPALRTLPAVVYFHENQLTYPTRGDDPRDVHFGLVHWTTALAAEQLWFNSAFHRDVFFDALERLLNKLPDRARSRPLAREAVRLRRRARVESPGISPLVTAPSSHRESPDATVPLSILWAARWEHDKDPETFFRALEHLAAAKVSFVVDVVGESFRQVPAIFETARKRLGSRARRWGYLSREEYQATLAEADVFVSTATHEFFGIAAVEAMAAGAWPLLPRRLAYPELLAPLEDGELFLWDGGAEDLAHRLHQVAERRVAADGGWAQALAPSTAAARRFVWNRRGPALDERLAGVVARRRY